MMGGPNGSGKERPNPGRRRKTWRRKTRGRGGGEQGAELDKAKGNGASGGTERDESVTCLGEWDEDGPDGMGGRLEAEMTSERMEGRADSETSSEWS